MRDVFDDAPRRRDHLSVAANPRPGLDFIVTLEGRVDSVALDGPVELRLRFVPDQHVLTPAIFALYLGALADYRWTGLEDLGQTVLGDLNSELVPRWIQLSLSIRPDGRLHSVLLEDRQPKWDNPTLLARPLPF